MHLVYATSIVPSGTPKSGYEIANAVILDALRRAGVRVTVVGFRWPDDEALLPDDTVVLGAVDVRTDTADTLRRLRWMGAALARGMTFSSAKLRALAPEAVRAALARIEPFDGYVLNSVQLAAAYPELFCDKPAIYVAHNVEHRSAEENAAAAHGLAERLLYLREARLLKAIETELCARARFVFTLAEEDRRLLPVGEGRSAALPMVATVSAPPGPSPRRPRYDAGLIGTWTWTPNRIGLEWFLREVVPLLGSGMSIAIAGRVPEDFAADDPRVALLGPVDDAAAFVRGAKIVPLVSRAGTGVQLKSIETFALGLPSVATSRALRGIAAPPENCLRADDAEGFARALDKAVASPLRDLDGRIFHEAQRAALDAEIGRGLMQFAVALERQAA